MRIDKFGLGSLILGIVLFFGALHFGFLANAGWNLNALAAAAGTIILSGFVLFGLFLIFIGLLLLFL